jgi:hypothetical protein
VRKVTAEVTLAEFVLAGIAEDEDLARRVFDTGWPRYLAVTPESGGVEASVSIGTYGPKDNFRVWQREHATEFGWTIHESGGIVWESERALRECEAKRRIVERAVQMQRDYDHDTNEWALAEADLRDLASVYGGHPDHREEAG